MTNKGKALGKTKEEESRTRKGWQKKVGRNGSDASEGKRTTRDEKGDATEDQNLITTETVRKLKCS